MNWGRPASQGQPVASGRGDEKRCSHCGSHHTSGSHWLRHPTTSQRLCNACWHYAHTHDSQLPPNSVLQRRPAEPRRLTDVRREMAQRRCLQCGSASPGNGKRPCWHRHPATGEAWLCSLCYNRVDWQVNQRRQKRQQRKQQAPEECSMQLGSGSGKAGRAEGEQARAVQAPPQRKRKLQQELHGPAGQTPAAFHDGRASVAIQRAKQQPAGGDGGGWVPPGQRQAVQHGQPGTNSSADGDVQQPAAKRRQRRKQAQPQHLPPQPPQQGEREPSLAPTVLVEGLEGPAGSEGPAAASLGGAQPATGDAACTAASAAAAAGTLPDEQVPAQVQQVAAQQQQPLPTPAEPETPEPDLSDLLQQAMEVAAAAASGLTPELVAAFAMLPPMEARRVSMLGNFDGSGCMDMGSTDHAAHMAWHC